MADNHSSLTSYDSHLFHEGTHFKSYNSFGNKLINYEGKAGVLFTLWTPNATEVRVTGNFNNWNGHSHIMKKGEDDSIWSLFIPGVQKYDIYKYEIHTSQGSVILKCDPYAFYSELSPSTASKIVDLNYVWEDSKYMENMKKEYVYNEPLNIYEVHLGSWKRKDKDTEPSYRELAENLISYVLDMGYTHIEILPIMEHPFGGSWGYQATGYYSITSRYGLPEDFMYFVNKCHENNIGVILDWVPGHFCKDDPGLYKFDGTHLYEYEDPAKGENYDWGTSNFDLGKKEVHSFLISNAIFWFEIYHIDGLRVDAVANMLYLDYGKKTDTHLRNKYGGNQNLEAVDFIKKLNKAVFDEYPGALMIAEESTTWPQVTAPTYIGGLGFNYKWNMGWMNDTLKYMNIDSIHKKWNHNLITFSLSYAFTENFILPLSHDEVVHGKKSLLNKMPGDYWQKFANLRILLGFLMAHPGKKMLFMGGEFGQFIEWKYDEELDWFLLNYKSHKSIQTYVKDLNHFYLKESSLWQKDHDSEGFDWIDQQNYNQSIISFLRRGKSNENYIIILCNFTPMVYYDYKIGVPEYISYREVFNSDRDIYGGSGQINDQEIISFDEPWNNQKYHIKIKIPPLSIVYIKPFLAEETI
ncbi:MAG TPA: 1,4-alpha-glucan branching protein GlgB [Clostridiaceae bacterium]